MSRYNEKKVPTKAGEGTRLRKQAIILVGHYTKATKKGSSKNFKKLT